VLSAALREALQLHRARLSVEAGESFAAAADTIVSTAQFRRRPAVETALKRWTAARLERVLDQLAAATLESRQLVGPAAPLADALAERALLRLAVAAARPSGSSATSGV
jgi:DNA polymerase III subunit delta